MTDKRSLFLLILFIFISCSGGNDGRTTLTFSFWGTLEQAKIEKKLINLFEKKNPDIRIKTLHVPADEYHRKMVTMAAGQTQPDIMMINGWAFSEYVDKKIIRELDEFITREKYPLDRFYPFAVSSFSRGGSLYGMPRDIAGRVMFCNRGILDKLGLEVPKTWEEFEKVCRRISLAHKEGKSMERHYGAIAWEIWINLLWGFGGDVFDDPHKPTRVTLNTPEALRSLEYLHSLHKNEYVTSPSMNDRMNMNELFRTGKAVFYFGGGRWLTPMFKNEKKLKWDIHPVPAGPAGAWSLVGGTCYGMSSSCRNPDAAWRFIKFYTDTIAVKHAISGGRTTPAIKDIATSEFFKKQEKPENIDTYIWSMENSRRWCYTPNRYIYEQIIFRVIDQLERQIIGPLEARALLQKELTAALKKNG